MKCGDKVGSGRVVSVDMGEHSVPAEIFVEMLYLYHYFTVIYCAGCNSPKTEKTVRTDNCKLHLLKIAIWEKQNHFSLTYCLKDFLCCIIN